MFDGGPFDKYELPLGETNYSTCSGPSGITFPASFLFFCDKDNCKSDNNSVCGAKYSRNSFDHCTTFYPNPIKSLNRFYQYMISDPLFEKTYDWCNDVCSSSFPTWVIIVIVVVGVLALVGVGVGIWWWRKKKGGKLPAMDDYVNADSKKLLA